MAWQKTKPADTDKIKNSASDIRDNWDAIETGIVPHDKLRLEEQGSAPSEVSGFGTFYTLSSDNELYFKSSQGDVTQLTNAGVSLVPRAYAKIAAAGSVVASTDFNVASVGLASNVYTITFTTAMPRADYVVVANAVASGATQRTYTVAIASQATTDFTAKVYEVDNSSIDAQSAVDWSFLVFSLD